MFIEVNIDGLKFFTSERGYELFRKAVLEEVERIKLEYNTDTSAGHPVKDDDIVRYSLETGRVKDKEP